MAMQSEIDVRVPWLHDTTRMVLNGVLLELGFRQRGIPVHDPAMSHVFGDGHAEIDDRQPDDEADHDVREFVVQHVSSPEDVPVQADAPADRTPQWSGW